MTCLITGFAFFTGCLLTAAFVLWLRRQNRLNRPALIPAPVWKDTAFTVVCIVVFFVWGSFNAVESILALFMQYVQHTTPSQTSIRLLPYTASGAVTNVIIGLIVHKIRGDYAIVVATGLSTFTTLLLALTHPAGSYWTTIFPGLIMNPIGSDVLYTVWNLVITGSFPSKAQAVAGGIFNTSAQLGKSMGLATAAIIASSITAKANYNTHDSQSKLLDGYRAAFWYCLALNGMVLIGVIWSLCRIDKVGLKRE